MYHDQVHVEQAAVNPSSSYTFRVTPLLGCFFTMSVGSLVRTPAQCMDGWIDGWMDGWMEGRTDGRMDGWMHGSGVGRYVSMHAREYVGL